MGQSLQILSEKKNKISLKTRSKFSFSIAQPLDYQIEKYTDLNSCYYLWQKFSPQRNLFETWEFRLAFFRAYAYQPLFLVAKRKTDILALLPLCFNTTKKQYQFFGSDWQEENYFFWKEKEAMKKLLKVAPYPLYLNALTKEAIEPFERDFKFEEEEPKYLLDLTSFRHHEDWLKTLKKNDRRDMRKDRNRILRQKPIIIFNNFSHLRKLIEISKERFQEKGEEADWKDPRRIAAFQEVIKLMGRSYHLRMISVKIKNKYAGVDLIALFKERYYTLKCGYRVKKFKGIGNFVNLFEIDDAIKLGFKKIDFLQNSYQWKSRWFSQIPLFKFEK